MDPGLCADMSGTNAIGVTGAVHVYAKWGTGLILYNGLDQDYQYSDPTYNYGSAQLSKIWLQELQQPMPPTSVTLPCGITVVGITLTPETAQNEVGTAHTVTATLEDLLLEPQVGVEVTFEVTAGPNASTSGVCSTNTDCTTDVNGQVSFTYTGDGGAGTDTIEACFTNEAGTEICSQQVSKEWIITNQPPVCSEATASPNLLWSPNHKLVPITILGVTDPDGDPLTISIDTIYQDEPVNSLGDGNTAPDGVIDGATAWVRAERTGTPKVPGNGRVYMIGFTADDDQGGTCSGSVYVGVPHDQGKKGSTPVNDGALYDSTQP